MKKGVCHHVKSESSFSLLLVCDSDRMVLSAVLVERDKLERLRGSFMQADHGLSRYFHILSRAPGSWNSR